MRVVVDPSLCSVNAECTFAAPEVFRILDGELVVDERPDDALRAAVEEAVAACPNQAIRLEER